MTTIASAFSPIGPVPDAWAIKPLQAVVRPLGRKNVGLVETNLLSLSYGSIIRKDIEALEGLLPESFEGYQIVEEDDVVFRFTDLQNDQRSLRSGLVHERGIITSAYLAVRPTSINARYFAYLMRAYDQEKVFYSFGGGVRQSLKFDDVKRLLLPVPSVERQRRIAEFLDRETAQIDDLIAKQEQLISTLAERRGAVIHSALTKGLSNSADSRESGVYWLGPIPTEWRVNKFSRVVRINGGQVDPREDSYASMLLVAPNHIEKETGRLLDQETAAEQGADSGKYLVKAGQVIYSKIRPALRKATIAPRDCLCSADMYAMSPDPSHLRESFLLYLLLSRPFTQFVTDVSSRVAMPKVNQEALALAYLWYPSLAEQDRIVDHLIAVTEQLDDLAAKAATVVEVLRERRQALISAAVTGKIDVGGAS